MLNQERAGRLTGLDTVQGALDTIETYFENGWTDGSAGGAAHGKRGGRLSWRRRAGMDRKSWV